MFSVDNNKWENWGSFARYGNEFNLLNVEFRSNAKVFSWRSKNECI